VTISALALASAVSLSIFVDLELPPGVNIKKYVIRQKRCQGFKPRLFIAL